jgi:hypothetical protein
MRTLSQARGANGPPWLVPHISMMIGGRVDMEPNFLRVIIICLGLMFALLTAWGFLSST